MRIGIGEAGEADEPQGIIDRFAPVAQQLASLEPERDVSPDRAPGIESWILKNHDARGIWAFNATPVHRKPSRTRRLEARDQAKQG